MVHKVLRRSGEGRGSKLGRGAVHGGWTAAWLAMHAAGTGTTKREGGQVWGREGAAAGEGA